MSFMAFLVYLFAITLTLAFSQSNKNEDHVLLFREKSSEGNGALLMVTFDVSEDETNTKCEYFTDQTEINEILELFNDAQVYSISEKDMKGLLNECSVREERSDEEGRENRWEEERQEEQTIATDSETTTQGYNGRPIIFPGTKWCGAGNIAESYDDLGMYEDTDRCCRAHDFCNDTLAPGETRNNLTNTSPFTALSCKCDHDFYNCLDRVNSDTSNTIGNTYFNILRRSCYEEDYPNSKRCKRYYYNFGIFRFRCREYYKDTEAPKEYRWVQAKQYRRIPGPLSLTLPPFPI